MVKIDKTKRVVDKLLRPRRPVAESDPKFGSQPPVHLEPEAVPTADQVLVDLLKAIAKEPSIISISD